MNKAVLVILAVLIASAIFAIEEIYRYIFRRKPSALLSKLMNPRGHEDDYYRYRDETTEKFSRCSCREYSIKSGRGEELKGYYYDFGAGSSGGAACGAGADSGKGTGAGRRIAFIVHGYRSEHEETGAIPFEYYRSRGIDVFCCDHTACGASGGGCIGFDVLEAPDCLRWTDFLISEFGEDTEIILHGFSMGAATVLQMSSHCRKNVKFIVSDSAYINARASLAHQVGPLYQPLRIINRIFGGYDLNDSDVRESLRNAKLPILFVHGRDDKLVPFSNGPELFDMYGGPKDSFFPAGTRHIEAFYTSPEEYGKKIDRFVGKYIK